MTSATMLPGFGRPVNYSPREEDPDYIDKLWGHGLSSPNDVEDQRAALRLLTLRELAMIQLMNSITDKADWNVKINDSRITGKWKEEALASGLDITSNMIDWCLEELRYKATLIPPLPLPAPPIVVYNGDVVKSDTALSLEFKQSLQRAIFAFEMSIPDHLRDWHPGSDGKVWDLVHPSLFPLVYGSTRILEDGSTTTLQDCIERCGQGKITSIPPENELQDPEASYYSQDRKFLYSRKFQWLPCEVDISNNEARITSYINNLHPLKECTLYALVENLVDASIPLWDLTLAPLQDVSYSHNRRVDYIVTYDPDPEEGPETDGPQRNEGESERDYYHRRWNWYKATRKVVLPELRKTFSPEYLSKPPKFSLRERYGARGLQVIVKLANIELTPEKPQYDGGTWHIEGQLNEHIVATSLYYYSCSNITDSFLSFRQTFTHVQTLDIDYRQNQHDFYLPVFGCEQEGPAVQEVGSIKTCEGRLVTFPNILHHCVEPFELADPTKPGHRKIVALFLVDPNIKIISTAHVPCQRQDWWWEAGQSTSQGEAPDGADNIQLPRELQDHILEGVDFPFSLQKAKTLREELMEERKESQLYWSDPQNVFTVSLCEH